MQLSVSARQELRKATDPPRCPRLPQILQRKQRDHHPGMNHPPGNALHQQSLARSSRQETIPQMVIFLDKPIPTRSLDLLQIRAAVLQRCKMFLLLGLEALILQLKFVVGLAEF